MFRKILMCLFLVLPLMFGGTLLAGDDITVTIDNEEVEFKDVEPFIDEDDRTQVPVRFISEEIGADVDWDADTETVTIEDEKRVIELVIGIMEYTVNDETKEMDTAPRIVDARTVVPLRFVVEGLGLEVDWITETNTVAIETDIEPVPIEPDPQVKLTVERDSYEEDEVIEFEIENTGNTTMSFEREFWVEYLVAEREDELHEALDEESLLLLEEPVTKWLEEEEIPEDWLMRRRDTEDKLAVGELPGEELDAGLITGDQQDIPISWVVVELERLWPDEPTILEPGETETQSFIPEVDFEEEAMNGYYRVVKEFSCQDTGEEFILHDNFRIDIDTGFDAALEMKDKEFTPSEEVEFEVINTGRTDIEFARPFGVARYVNGDWVEVELDMVFPHDIVPLNPGETFQQGFVPEEDFADPADVVEGSYIVAKLVWCRETDNSKVVVDEFRLTEIEEEEAFFQPRVDAPEEVDAGEEFEITYAVKNTGEQEDTQEVYFRKIVDEEIGVESREKITLEPEEVWRERETYTAEADESYRFELETDDDSVTQYVNVITEEEAEFVTGIEAPEEVMVGDQFEVQVGIRNVGEAEGTQEVTMTKLANGEEETRIETITLAPDEVWTETEGFIAEEGIEEYRFMVQTEDDSASHVVEIIHYELH